MIKIFSLVFVLIAIHGTLQAPQENPKSTVKPSSQRRNCNSYLDDAVRKDLRETGDSDSEKFKKYVNCVYVAHRLLKENGEINCDIMKKHLLRHIRPAKKAEEIYDRCVKEADCPEDTAYNIHRCVQESLGRLKKKATKKSDDNKE